MSDSLREAGTPLAGQVTVSGWAAETDSEFDAAAWSSWQV